MAKLSQEEREKETADWLKGFIVLAVFLIIALVGYFAVTINKNKLTYTNTQVETK